MKIFVRKLHRWLGLLMAVQIAAWMLSGFYFSLFPITEIRGEHLVRATETPSRAALTPIPALGEALAGIDRHLAREWELGSWSVYSMNGQPYWRVEGTVDETPFVRLVELGTGQVRPALSADEAGTRARTLLLQPGSDPSVTWLQEEPENLEFRGRPLPVWRVAFAEPENLNLYLDPWTGELLARRTDRWRIFDFLWMLHIMDFDMRDDFNHPLLQVSAFLGLVVALGGLLLWALTSRFFRRRAVRD